MADLEKLCIWKTSKDIQETGSNFDECRKCKGTRDYAVGLKCISCMFKNPDGSYTCSYRGLIAEATPKVLVAVAVEVGAE
jgi:hypothetical protein